ncbi:MAG: MBL fold metallo-hydrolase [Thermoprotei archaeon]|nr:MAG: MBL fold metallo-hydrolase [Thermoprotei archaeon]
MRYGRPPHPREFKALEEARKRIEEYAERADIVTISHYHLDHYTPPFKSIYTCTDQESFIKVYQDKLVLVKNFEENINVRQRLRAKALYRSIKDIVYKLIHVDGYSLNLGDTLIKFSKVYPHGPDGSKLGWILMVTIVNEGTKVLFAPDVQGPMSSSALKYILTERPEVLILGGPPTYLSGIKVAKELVERGLKSIALLSKVCKTLVLEHHLLRDLHWREQVFKYLEEEVGNLITASQILGRTENLLEARRAELYEEEPPDKEFLRWVRQHRKSKE